MSKLDVSKVLKTEKQVCKNAGFPLNDGNEDKEIVFEAGAVGPECEHYPEQGLVSCEKFSLEKY